MSVELEMSYNSARNDLIMPEYGRNIQKLIRYAQKIEDPKYRQVFVDKVVELMMQMNPQSKNIDDNREKLWKHLFKIAEYHIDVKPPFDELPQPEDARKQPEAVDYPRADAKFRHYGNNVQKLIEKALSMEEGPKRDEFSIVIGSYMKLAYRTWNKEPYVSDDIIKADLQSLSDGKLKIKDNVPLDVLSSSSKRRKRGSSQSNYGNGSDGGSSNGSYRGKGKGRRKK